MCDLFAKESFSNATLKPTSVAAILAPGATSANAATATVVVGGLAPYAKFNESMLLDGEAMQRDENCSWGARAAASGASLFVASPHDSVVGAPNADAAGALFARALGALELHATLVRVDESPTRMLPRFVLVVSDASHCTCVVQLWFDNLNRENEKKSFPFLFFFFRAFFSPLLTFLSRLRDTQPRTFVSGSQLRLIGKILAPGIFVAHVCKHLPLRASPSPQAAVASPKPTSTPFGFISMAPISAPPGLTPQLRFASAPPPPPPPQVRETLPQILPHLQTLQMFQPSSTAFPAASLLDPAPFFAFESARAQPQSPLQQQQQQQQQLLQRQQSFFQPQPQPHVVHMSPLEMPLVPPQFATRRK